MSLGLYINGTTGARDGVRVGEINEADATVAGPSLAILALNSPVGFHVREDVGLRTPVAVTLDPVTNRQGSLDANCVVSANGSSWVASGAAIGIVGDVNVPAYVKQVAASGTTSVYIRSHYGGAGIALPLITAGPSITSVSPTGCVITAAFNASVTGAKYIAKTNNTAPSSGDWASAAAFASPQTVSGLPGATLHYAFVRVVDADGFAVVSTPQAFTTSSASNVAPTFSAQPSVYAVDTTSISYEWGQTDADADTISVEYSGDNGSTWGSISATYNAGNSKYRYTKTGLSPSTSVTAKFRLTDTNHTGTNGTVSNAVTQSTASAVPTNVAAATLDYLANVVSFDAVPGASSYNIYFTSDGSTPTTASTKLTGVTSPYVHASLTAGLAYKYALTSIWGGAESALSAVVTVAVSTLVTFEVAQTPYSPYNGTFARATDQAHAGTYSSKVVGVASGWGPKLTKAVTMPSADSVTKNFTRWFRVNGATAGTGADGVVIGLAPDQAVSAWGPFEVSIPQNIGGTYLTTQYWTGTQNLQKKVWTTALTANKWYKVSVALSTGTDNRGTVAVTLYDSDGTTQLATTTDPCCATGWKSAGKYLIAGCYLCGTSFNMWIDDIQDDL